MWSWLFRCCINPRPSFSDDSYTRGSYTRESDPFTLLHRRSPAEATAPVIIVNRRLIDSLRLPARSTAPPSGANVVQVYTQDDTSFSSMDSSSFESAATESRIDVPD